MLPFRIRIMQVASNLLLRWSRRLARWRRMTHGSLYSQFGSKERLIEEAVGHAITTKQQETPEVFSLRDCVSAYLSAAHRQPAPELSISRLSLDGGSPVDPYARRKPIFTFSIPVAIGHGCRWPINPPYRGTRNDRLTVSDLNLHHVQGRAPRAATAGGVKQSLGRGRMMTSLPCKCSICWRRRAVEPHSHGRTSVSSSSSTAAWAPVRLQANVSRR